MIRVLFVDDDLHLLNVSRLYLKRTGFFEIDTASSAKEALAKLAATRYDIVVSDYEMPTMDGIEFLRLVRKTHGDLPFIIFTGRGREEVVIEALNEGADFYLQKGGEPEPQFVELEHKIRKAVERRATEKKLNDSQEQLSEVISFFPDAVLAIDADKRVIIWNRAMEQMSGIPAAEMIGKGDYAYTVPFYGYARPQLMDLLFEPEHIIREKYPSIRKEGESISIEVFCAALYEGKGAYLSAKACPLRDSAGKMIGAIESIRDISRQKNAEENLQQSEEQFRAIFATQQNGILIIDPADHRIIDVNPYLISLIGSPKEQIVGKICHAFVCPAETGKCPITDLGQCVDNTEHLLLTAEGKGIPVIKTSVRIRIGEKEYLMENVQDITMRKQTEKLLRESEERSKTILDKLPDLVLVHREGKILYVNPAMVETMGVRPADVLNMSFDKFVVPEYRSRVADAIRTRLETGQEKPYEIEILSPLYGRRAVLVQGSVIEFDGATAILNVLTDITERKHAERKVQESEEKYRSVLEHIQDIYYRSDREGNLVMASPSTLSILGYSSMDEILGKPIATTFYSLPEMRNTFLTALQKYGGVKDYEATLRKKDGTPVIVSTSSQYYYDAEGNIAGVEGIIRDITERKQAETAVRESEEKYRTVIEKANEAIMIAQDGVFVFANESLSRLLGIPSEQLKGTPFAQYIWPDDRASVVARYQKRIVGEEIGDAYDFRVIGPGGKMCWVFLSAARILWQGRPATLNLMTDITDRKVSEEALKKSEARYRHILDTAQEGIWIVDSRYRTTFVNEHMSMLIGYPVEDLMGRPVTDFIVPEQISDLDLIASQRKQGMSGQFERAFIRKDGTILWTLGSSAPLFEKGEFAGSFAMFSDITYRKQAEETLRESEESYHGLFNTILQAVYILDSEGKFIDVNSGAEEMYGYEREEFIGKTPEFLSAPGRNDFSRVAEYLRKAFAGEPQEFEFWGIRKNGMVFPKDVRLYRGTYFGRDVIIAIGTDITGSKRAEEVLREREELFRTIFNQSPIAIELYDPDGCLIDINPACCTLFGIDSADQVKGFRLFEDPNIPADQKEQLRQGKTIHYETIFDFDLIIRLNLYPTSRRGTLTLDVVITPIRECVDRPFGYLVQIVDVTDKKRAENFLKEKNEILSRSEEIAHIGSWVLDLPVNKLVWSDEVYRIFGLEPQEFAGSQEAFFERVHPEDLPGVAETYSRSLRDGSDSFEIVHRIFRKNTGEIRIVREKCYHVRDALNTIIRSVGMVHDITESYLAEEALRESEERYRALFSAESDTIFVVDRNTGMILDCNSAVSKMYGYSREELIGRPNTQVSAEAEATREATEHPLNHIPFRYHKKKDGTVFPVEIQADVISLHGNPVIVAAVRDITERKRFEDALKRTNRQLNLLLSVTRHDIRNSILSLNAYLNYSKKTLDQPVKTLEYINLEEQIVDAIKHQINFTKEYEDLGVNPPAWQNAGDCIRDAIKGLDLTGINLEICNLDRVEILADPLLRKVFFNLVDNSLRHGGDNLKCIRFTSGISEGDLVLTCEDDGCGIPADEKECIFERGYGKNTGYGLFLIREILAITGISIRETGTPGKGARFEFVVPRGSYCDNGAGRT
jgi:PAS domain S-box-containing protein